MARFQRWRRGRVRGEPSFVHNDRFSLSIRAACLSPRSMITYMLLSIVLHVREYVDPAGRSPFTGWLRALNVQAAAKVATALERIAAGNLSNIKTVGGGVLQYRVDFGPGYRIYFGRDGGRLVILLAGGTKKRQQQIGRAHV